MAQQFESDYIFGIHEPGGERHMINAGRPGWIVFTEEIGYDPAVQTGRDYRAYSDQRVGIIVRLNNGYYPNGTIPHSRNYANFAQRCANFVANSRGCKIWIIGNEMNYRLERPPSAARSTAANTSSGTPSGKLIDRLRGIFQSLVKPGENTNMPTPPPDDPYLRSSPERFSAITPAARGTAETADRAATAAAADDGTEAITPALYAQCYKLCRDAIRRVAGHEDDQVLIGAVAPWNNQTTYPGNTRGDWVQYFQDILNALGPSGLDGITLHTYTHQSDPNLITSEQKMNPPFADRRYEFRAYMDFMNAIPATLRSLPVYITETNQDVPWLDQNIAWVQRAYGEIHWWNQQPNNQQIRALVLYRWPVIDRWFIEGKGGVVEDFKTALQQEYRWRAASAPVWPFVPNNTVVTTTAVNLRRSPGYVGKAPTDILVQVPADARMTILSAVPQQADGLDWWQVRYNPAGQSALTGWTAHKSPAGVELLRIVSDVGGDVAGTFKIGDSVRTMTVVRMRRSPGVVGKPTNDVIAEIPANTVATVLAGPRAVDGLTWWQLRINSSGQEGWLAEKLATGEALLVLNPGVGPVEPPITGKFKVGERVVTLSAARLRQTPGYANKPSTDIVADIAQGVEGRILGGPSQADNLSWWQLETANAQGARVSGWMAETAPGGIAILKSVDGTGTTPAPSTALAPGDLVMAAANVRVRRTAGYVNKTDSDVLGEFAARATLNLLSGPQSADGLAWWRVGGILSSGREAIGWVAETAPNGTTLIARPAKLAGTQIPDKATKRYFGLPFQGNFGISQLWGENPDIYNKISYDNVPLRGHNGIDFMTPLDTPVLAVDNGVVAETVQNDPTGFGRYVKVTHSWGEALYAHLNTINVAAGQQVARGAVLGASGNTGFSFGPHLHFAIRINPYSRTDGWGGFSDPLPYFDSASVLLPAYVTDSSGVRVAAPVQMVDARALRTLLAEKPGYAPDKPGLRRP